MSEQLKKYSIPWRQKLAKVYEFKEQYILDMSKDQINALELGIAGGFAKARKDFMSKPDFLVDILKAMDDESRNKILDEFCEAEDSDETVDDEV